MRKNVSLAANSKYTIFAKINYFFKSTKMEIWDIKILFLNSTLPSQNILFLLGPSLKFVRGFLPLSFPSYRRPLHCGGFTIRQNLGLKSTIMTEQLILKGTLKGHNGWVTQIATNPSDPDTILSSSRGML